MLDYGLSPQQLVVICALSSGASMIAAAQQAGVHRNTIANWRRNYLPFQQALADAQYDRALFFREKLEDLADLAVTTLHDLLADPKTPANVRLKAALAVLQTASAPPAPKKQIELDIEKIVVKQTPAATITEEQLAPAPPQNLHNAAQSTSQVPVNTRPSAPAPPPNLHNAAQPTRQSAPKIGRNDPCPCGSGQKYKRCCIDQLVSKAA